MKLKALYVRINDPNSTQTLSDFQLVLDTVDINFAGLELANQVIKLFTLYFSKASTLKIQTQNINYVDNDVFCLNRCKSITYAIYAVYCEQNLKDPKVDPLMTLHDLMYTCIKKAPALIGAQYQDNMLNSIQHFVRYFPKETSGHYPYAVDLFKACAQKEVVATQAILPQDQTCYGNAHVFTLIYIAQFLNDADYDSSYADNCKRFFEISLQYWRKCCYGCYLKKLEENITKKYLSADESKIEWMHLAEVFVARRDATASIDPMDSKGNLEQVLKCYGHALDYCVTLHPGNNAITAEILNDIAVTYHKLSQIDSGKYQAKYTEAEQKYEVMMQNIKQGIH